MFFPGNGIFLDLKFRLFQDLLESFQQICSDVCSGVHCDCFFYSKKCIIFIYKTVHQNG